MTGDYMSDCGISNGGISFYSDKPDDITNEELQEVCDKLNASIANKRKDNIEMPDIEKLIEKFLPNQFDLTSFKPNEIEFLKSAFQQGATVMVNELKNISQNERKDSVGSDAIEFADWIRTFEALEKKNGYWVLESQVSSEELYRHFKSQQK